MITLFSPNTVKADSRLVIPKSSRIRLPEVEQLQLAAGRAPRHVEPHQRAETHAVHVGHVGQIEHHAPVIRQQRPDTVIEDVIHARHESAVAAHHRRFARQIHFKTEYGGSRGLWHRLYCIAHCSA